MSNEVRLIDANALMELVQYRIPIDNRNAEVIAGCVDITRRLIQNAPTVDAEPVKYGRWITRNKGRNNWCECSECNTVGSPFWKRCPMCEAKMDKEN